MKVEAVKSKKQRQQAGPKTKPVCGTLSYLAECRGMTPKAEVPLKTAPPEIIERNIRRYPVAP